MFYFSTNTMFEAWCSNCHQQKRQFSQNVHKMPPNSRIQRKGAEVKIGLDSYVKKGELGRARAGVKQKAGMSLYSPLGKSDLHIMC